jgi:Serine dehydrogenase proteinase
VQEDDREDAPEGRDSPERGGGQGRGPEDRAGAGSARGSGEAAGGEADGLPDAPSPSPEFPRQTPLYYASHSERYERQKLIQWYEERFHCRFVVMLDDIFPESVTLFEELIFDCDADKDLHLMLDSPGGDGETAVRLVRSAQARCRELTVIVPNQAKSAATLLVMGAHSILMGPTSDLGPVDPQFQSPTGRGLYAAKDLIAAVENAETSISANPESYPLYVSLLADVTAVMVQQARSALERTTDLVKEALQSNPDRSPEDVGSLAGALQKPLVDLPHDHGAVFGARAAREAGLPVIDADPRGEQWRVIWLLWAKYFALHAYVYEGRLASQVMPRQPV